MYRKILTVLYIVYLLNTVLIQALTTVTSNERISDKINSFLEIRAEKRTKTFEYKYDR